VRRLGVVAGGALAVLVLAVLALATCQPPRRTPIAPPAPDLSASAESIATSTGPFHAGPVAPPGTGAYLGAWVRPDSLTPPGRLAAVSTLEGALGRRLDIVHTYRRWDEPLFNESDVEFGRRGATMMVSWAGGDTRSITMGRHDDLIRDRARRVREFGRPLLLRFRWEMDRPGLAAAMWSPADYVAAWRHVRDLFRAENVTNVSWVWCPTVEGFADGRAALFYPGDDQVDWVCVDAYAGSRFATLGELLRPFLVWAAAHPGRPIVIGEFGVARIWGTGRRAAWLRNAAAVFRANPQIRAVLYFESDPDGHPAEQQFRLSSDPPVLAAFAEWAREPYFNPGRR
jgi:Glycosyl hydrolase family 26